MESVGCPDNLLTLLAPKDDFIVAEETKCHLKLSAKNMESNGWHLNPRTILLYAGQLFWCQKVRCMNCQYASYDKYLYDLIFTSVTAIRVSPDKIV